MVIPSRRFITVCCISALIIVSSCTSTKKISSGYDRTPSADVIIVNGNRKHLENRLGMKIHPKDDMDLYSEVASWIGVPYRFAGNSRKGTDCSGLVQNIYRNVYHILLERNSASMQQHNCNKVSREKLSEGDLVFFATGREGGRIDHVGLYLKEGKFVHATNMGVVVSALDEPYYRRTFRCAGRVKNRKY